MMSPEFTQTFFLSAGEVNAEGEMSLALLTSKIIDIATAHANSLGIGNPSMEALGRGWVLSRVAVEMERYPRVNETYMLSTWIEDWNRHFSVRNFMVKDAGGKAIGHATSVWMVLDTRTHENAGLSHLSLAPALVTGEKSLARRPGRHAQIVENPDGRELPRGVVAATAPAWEYTFQYGDLDYYRHVNTVRYVTMLLNQFPLDEMDSTRVKRLEMAFMREGRYGESVRLMRADDGLQTWFALADAAGGGVLVSAALERCPRS